MTNSIPKAIIVPTRDLKTYLFETLPGKQFNELHIILGITNSTWMGRRFSDPNSFKLSELEKLAELTGLSRTTLMDDYCVAMQTLTAAQADEIRKDDISKGLTAADKPAGKPAGGTTHSAK